MVVPCGVTKIVLSKCMDKNTVIYLTLMFLLAMIMPCIAVYNISRQDNYKHQVLMPQFCDEYLTVKKSDVPISCYEYFGIK